MKSPLTIKKSYIAVLYRTPSQNSLEFDNFILSFEKLLCEINSFKPDFSIILGDLMQDQIVGGLVILKQVKDLELMLSQPHMDFNN